MSLPNEIYRYYLENKASLTQDKQFHFATRMAAWHGYPETYDLLRELKEYIAPSNVPPSDLIKQIIETPQTGRRNAHELRQPFFEKYPLLYGAHAALFRVRHLESVYGIDAREALYGCIPRQVLLDMREALLEDTEALKVLSTFAVNYCYLLTRVVERDPNSLDLGRFLNAGSLYNLDNKTDLQLLIYLYTHCIIGESNFYTQRIPAETLGYYTEMLGQLEAVIQPNLSSINLDNKLEYLVSARICNYSTDLFDPIFDEASRSVSPEGTFLIDMHNDNIQADRNDFVKSEHRNVLYIMSAAEYNPHSTRVV